MNSLEAAIAYVRRGMCVIPVPHMSKNPGIESWPDLRISESDLPTYFNCRPQNIGLLLGDPSGGIVDVDLDHPAALSLADRFLPVTPAIFGRPGKPRSHRIYRVVGPVKSFVVRTPDR